MTGEGEGPLLKDADLTAGEFYYLILREFWSFVKEAWRFVKSLKRDAGERRDLWKLPEGLPRERLRLERGGAFEARCE